MDAQTQQLAGIAAGAETLWKIDPGQSTIGFSIKHMKFATVHGRFNDFRGTIRFDGERDAAVDVSIDAGSIDTGNARRDEHLRSADFFDAAGYPTITFHGTRLEPGDSLRPDHWRLTGDLTMRGATLPVELEVKRSGADPVFWDVEVATFAATTRLSRRQFGIGLNFLLETGGLVIADEVNVAIHVQVVEESPGAP